MKQPSPGRSAVNCLLLLKLPSRGLDALFTIAVAALIGVSRFAYLANGPWEWDETLFARGMLHFELAAHFPHPPGFPGWLALGHLLMPLTHDPLRALQIASAVFSLAAVWILAALGRRIASPPVAVAAALLVLAAPGPWLYSVRGFSTTAAAVLTLAAGVVAVGGLAGRRLSYFSLLVTAAFLVRPIMLPTLGVLWLACVWRVRPLRRLVPGVTAGLFFIAVANGFMMRLEGGWGAFSTAFMTHGGRHFSRLVGNLGGYPDLGLVKGFGGVVPATLLFLLAAIGLVVWAKRYGRRSAYIWALVLVVTVAQLVWLQNRTYGRYAVGAQMAIAPLVAASATLVPPAAACIGLLGAAAWFGVASFPLIEEQHRTQLPGWSAVHAAREAAMRSGRTVVVEPELHPFLSYLWHLSQKRGEPTPPWALSPWAPEPWTGIEGPWLVATVHRNLYPDPLRGVETNWSGVSERLEPLTQQRFLDAWVIDDPPLPVQGWWPSEKDDHGRRFMWGGVDAVMAIPPVTAGSVFGLTVRPAPGPEPVAVRWLDHPTVSVAGEGGEEGVWFDVSPPSADRVTDLHFSRSRAFPAGGGDDRPLSVQLFDVRVIEKGSGWSVHVAQPWRRSAMRIEVAGAYEGEVFGNSGEGVWFEPRGAISVPAAAGTLRLRVWAPRPTPPRTEIFVGRRLAAGPLEIGRSPIEVVVPVHESDIVDGRVTLEMISEPYRPADTGLDDQRTLGLVVSTIAFEPDGGAS